jgi:hypothetical protein
MHHPSFKKSRLIRQDQESISSDKEKGRRLMRKVSEHIIIAVSVAQEDRWRDLCSEWLTKMIAVLSVDRSGDLHLNQGRVSQIQHAMPKTGGGHALSLESAA